MTTTVDAAWAALEQLTDPEIPVISLRELGILRDVLGKFADSPNAKTILFPVEATQLIGSLGGVGELLREVVGPQDGATSAAPRLPELGPGDVQVPSRSTSAAPRPSVPRSGGQG